MAGEASTKGITMAVARKGSSSSANGDRNKALELALSQIDKQFGKGSVMRLGDDSRPPVQVIPSPGTTQ